MKDLEALRGLTNLNLLYVDDSSVEDISPLRGLGVSELRLRGNKITDLSPMAELDQQQRSMCMRIAGELDLTNNNVSNVSALSGCTSLDKLRLSGAWSRRARERKRTRETGIGVERDVRVA